MTDPAFFVDDDGKVYLYYGCSNVEPLHAVELDPQRALEPIGAPVDLLLAHPERHGWERHGDNNELGAATWLEGAWMTKLAGRYYLQYAAPGTEYKSYADGSYTALQKPTLARYVRVTSQRVPSGRFALSGLRIFGNGGGAKPARVAQITVVRDPSDRRRATLTWSNVPRAIGYNVRYGNAPGSLVHDHTVYGQHSLDLNCLDIASSYWFTVDVFNENGLSRGTKLVKVD